MLNEPFQLPVWIDKKTSEIHHTLPEELQGLRHGEKLLIQKLSTHVPLVHLKYGQYGISGHVCSFPQNIQEICNTLPRQPKDVEFIQVVKKSKIGSDMEYSIHSFTIRKSVVLNALYWLKNNNEEYCDIEISESNLDWMENNEEKELPTTGANSVNIVQVADTSELEDEDLGPAPEQNEKSTNECYGMVSKSYINQPGPRNRQLTEELTMSAQKGNEKNAVR